MKPGSIYEFGPFCLDASERILLRERRLVPLAPKALSTLLVLVRNRGHVVEKDVLMAEVWPDEVVEEGNLAQHVFMVRRALGETPEIPEYIETIPRRGYRFLGEVRQINPSDPASIDQEQELTKRYTESSEAYQAYLKGRFYWNKRSEAGLKKSIGYFNKAINLDPIYALAHAGLADSYNMLGFYCMLSPSDAFPKAKASALTALAIDRNLACAHASLGFVKLHYNWDCQGAEQSFKQAIQLDPNYVTAHLMYGCHLTAAGRFDEAIAEYKRALEIEPLLSIANAALGYGYYFARRYDEAIEQCKDATEMDEHFELAHLWLGWAYEQNGTFKEAIDEYEKALALSGGRTSIIAALGTALALSGKKDQAQTVLVDLSKQAEQRYVSPYRVACIHAALGNVDSAFEWLEKAYEGRSHLLVSLKVDPKLDSLRSDPRFASLVDRIVPAKHYTESGEAYRLYLKGRYCWSQHKREGLEQAAEYFRQAIELDPDYALAYAAIIDCYLRLTTNYFSPADAPEQTLAAIHIGAMEDMPPETQASLKVRDAWDLATVEREIKRARELKSNFPAAHQWHAAYLFSRSLYHDTLGRVTEEPNGFLAKDGQVSTPGGKVTDQFHSSLTPAEEVQILCIVAREQVEAGNIEAACLVIQPWYAIGEWPRLEGLPPESCADLLYTAGLVAGRLVSTRQVPRGQKHAEALLNGAIGLCEQLGLKTRSAEGRSELGMCYHREGAFDLALTSLLAALEELPAEDRELRSMGHMRLAFVERQIGRLQGAMVRLNEVGEIAQLAGPWTKSYYHSESATMLKELGAAANRDEYFDQARKHYQLAFSQYGAVGQHQCVAVMQNNFGFMLLTLKKLKEAEPHLVLAREFFDHLSDRVRCAQVDETLAQLHLAAGRFDLAEQAIIRSVATLETGGEEALLAESLRTQGRILCKLDRQREAKRVIDRAYQVAERCGDSEGAGLALLIVIEEISRQLEDDELLELRTTLRRLLGRSQRTPLLERVEKCLELASAHSNQEAVRRQRIKA